MVLASVGYTVPLIPQTTGMSCRAAGIAMIVGWRDRSVLIRGLRWRTCP